LPVISAGAGLQPGSDIYDRDWSARDGFDDRLTIAINGFVINHCFKLQD
jgi:hypothetical protein